MLKFRPILKWTAFGLALILVVVIIGAAIITRTQDFERWVRQQAIGAINDAIRGSVSVERLEGSIWRKLTLYNVALRYEEAEILHVPRIEVSFSLISLIFGQLKIGRLDAERPRAILNQDRDGRWNVIEALALREPDPKKNSEFAVNVRSLRLRDGALALRFAGAGAKLYRLSALNLEGRMAFSPAAAQVEAREVMAGLVADGQPNLQLKGALAYDIPSAASPVVRLKDFWVISANSRMKLNGEIAHGDTVSIKAEAALDKLAPSDIAYFVPDWPIKRDLAGSLAVNGLLNDLNGNLQLTAAGAGVSVKFNVDVAAAEPHYRANATFDGFDLTQWLESRSVAGVASGAIQANGTGFALGNAVAQAQLSVRGASIQGWTLGPVAMQAQLRDSVAALDGRLKSPLGGADWSGKITLRGKSPAYEVALSVRDLDVQKAVGGGHAIQGKINFQGTVNGTGFNLADLDTRVDLRILPSSLGSVNVKQGSVNAALRDKKIRIARATLSTTESALSVNGEFSLDTGLKGILDYQLRVGDLSPWLSLANQKGSGSVDLSGKIEGNLADAQTRGTARLADLRWDAIAVKDGNVTFSLRRTQDRPFPQGSLTARLTDIEAGLAFRRIDATAKLAREPSDSIQLDVSALDRTERKHELSGSADFVPDATTVRVNRFSLTAPDGAWSLAQPATATHQHGVFFIEQLSIRNGDREVSLNGRFAFAGDQDLTLVVQRLPLTSMSSFLPQQPKISGLLAVQARITGTAAAPEFVASARLSDSTVAGQVYAGAVASVEYKNRRANLQLAVQQDASHFLNGSGTLPLDLSWHDGWRAEFADGMELRVQSAGLSLSFLNAFGGKSVENIAGELSLDIRARGSAKQPDLSGTFSLRDGKLKAVPLGVDIQQVVASGSLDSRHVTLRQISARANGGEISGSGSLALRDFQNGAVKLSLAARRWPAIETLRHQIKIDGNVDVQGSLNAPLVKGQLTVSEGSLRPDLDLLEQSKVPLKRDETIVILKSKDGRRETVTKNAQSASAADHQAFKNATLEVAVRAPGNLWIRHPDIVSELSGNVRATKSPGGEIDLTGRIDVVRGWVSFQGRRFQLARGRIEFTGGPKIDPALDIVAQYRLPQYQVEAIIGGTAAKPSLTLASQPRLEQADILSLVVFGKPIDALDRNEQGSLQQSALSIASGYAAGRIANSVSEALGLDSLGIDIRQVDFSGGRVGFGSYVGRTTFVSVSQQLSGEQGSEVSVEYQIAPDWKINSSTTSAGGSGIDLIWHKRY